MYQATLQMLRKSFKTAAMAFLLKTKALYISQLTTLKNGNGSNKYLV